MNNCVGENNIRYFHAFLLSTAILCAYCAYLCWFVMVTLLDEGGVTNLRDKRTGKAVQVPWLFVLQYTVVHGKTVFPLVSIYKKTL